MQGSEYVVMKGAFHVMKIQAECLKDLPTLSLIPAIPMQIAWSLKSNIGIELQKKDSHTITYYWK